MHDRLAVAIQIEECARLLEEAMDEQRKIISDLLKSIQDYVDSTGNEYEERAA